ncbi:hypothetical protein scyTo_0016712, partial [Scyliorhinus torazame]|nr:hypothetical protein [Scyliorhinus torazame]
ATFDGEKHTVKLPSVNSVSFVLRFLEKLCYSLQCENLFSSQPFSPYVGNAHSPTEYERVKTAKEETLDPPTLNRGLKRFPQESPPYTAPLSPKLPRTESHPLEAETLPAEENVIPKEHKYSESLDSALNSVKPPSPHQRNSNPSTWSIEEVMKFVREADPQALAPHADLFRKHEIDGKALLLLRSDMIMKYMGLKLGPALKLCYHIERLKHGKY